MGRITSIACLTGGLVLLAAESPAAAQVQHPLEPRVGLELLTGAVDPDQAEQAGVGTRAWGIQLSGAVTAFRILTVGVDLGAVGLRDNRQFTENTTEGEKSSGVGAGMGSLALGLRTPPLALALGGANPARVSAGVNVGHTWMDANRTIERCVDCHAEDVNIRAGDFWEPALTVYSGASNIRDAVMIGYSSNLGWRAAAPAEVPADVPADVPAEAP
jgi:hypothetical protein